MEPPARKRIWGTSLFLFFLTLLLRVPFQSSVLYHWDSVQYALAIKFYDILIHQPHPPGYFLYVMLGTLTNLLTNEANKSFVLLSMVVSALTVVAVYRFAQEIFDEKTAIVASLLTMTSPSVWFNSEVALNYIFESFFSVVFAHLCWKTLSGKNRAFILASFLLSGAAGVRQTTLLFLLPLWGYVFSKVPTKYRIYAGGTLIITFLSWYIPMISWTGGYARYRLAS